MRKVALIAAALVSAIVGFTLLEGKPDAKACVGGPVDPPSDPPSDPGNSGPLRLGGAKHGKDGAMDGS